MTKEERIEMAKKYKEKKEKEEKKKEEMFLKILSADICRERNSDLTPEEEFGTYHPGLGCWV